MKIFLIIVWVFLTLMCPLLCYSLTLAPLTAYRVLVIMVRVAWWVLVSYLIYKFDD
jgi:hypothetical protein